MTLRIGLDAHMVGHHETGNETYVLGLIEGLSSLETDIELFVYHTGALAGSEDGRVHARRLAANSSSIRLSLELPLRSWRDDLDVLHTTYTSPVWARCPLVLTVHDISFAEHPEWFSARDLRVLSTMVPWSIRRAARVITVSKLCARQIIDRYHVPEDKVTCIYNGPGRAARPITAERAYALVRALGIDTSRPIVLAVGNLQPRKNLVRLIEAFERVLAGGIDADLVLTGPEHYRADLIHDAAAGLDRRVRFTGYLSDEQLAACYATATLFAFPSLFEGFGIPAIEAMAHGTPVVCSDTGALPEVCRDAALYFDPTSVESMASALATVLRDQATRDRLSEAGTARQREFSWSRAATETLNVYRETVALGDATN
jgi:glycosyltransferase involved in cell wall biosynthesis